MKASTTTWRATAVATAFSMTLGGVAPVIAAPPPIGGPDPATPPSRVGRLARISGTVSFHTADQTSWSPATLNYPVSNGNAFWTEPSATALVEVSSNRVAMDSSTELDIATLDDHALVASEPQGALYLNLRRVPSGDTYVVQTPRGAVQIAAAGRYEVVAGDTDHPTTVTVLEGAAQVSGTNIALQVGNGQTATISGSDQLTGDVGPIVQDAFLAAMLAQERPPLRSAVAAPRSVERMTGAEDLEQYGSWQQTPQNGAVWYPQVESGWVPYRHGRWSYVAPWGWTWVDDAQWGFAPFHYGRWIQTDDRWGWVPAESVGVPVESYAEPVYAPALVSFVDVGAAAAVGAAVGFAAGALLGGGDRSVGWVPLGPNEPYYPPYSHRLDYIRAMNGPNIRNVSTVITNNSVTNVTNVTNNNTTVNNFINRGAATVVPAPTMVQSAPVAAAARPLSPQQLTQVRAQFRAPVLPTAATAGVTPTVARQFNIPAAARPPAPVAGPVINPAALHVAPPHATAAAFVPPLHAAVAGGAPNEAARAGAAPVQAPRPPVAPPAIGPGGPGAPEPAKPGVPEPPKAMTPEPAKPGLPEPPKTGGPTAATEPAKPAAPEVARPGVLPALRPSTPPAAQAGRAPTTASAPAVEPRGLTAPRPPAPAAVPRPAEPLRPGISPSPAAPPPHAEASRPAPAPAPLAPPARPVPAAQPARPAPPPHPVATPAAPRPESAMRAAPPPAPFSRTAPPPQPRAAPPPPPRPAPPPPRPAPPPPPRPAPPPPPRPAPPPPRPAPPPPPPPRPAPPPSPAQQHQPPK